MAPQSSPTQSGRFTRLFAQLGRFFAYLRSALQESEGVDSSVRLSLFIVTVTAALVVLTWLGLSVYVTIATLSTKTPALGLLPFAKETSLAIASLFALAAGAKQWQYGKEPENAPKSAPDSGLEPEQ